MLADWDDEFIGNGNEKLTINHGVENRHGSRGDGGVGVNLLENWKGKVSKLERQKDK